MRTPSDPVEALLALTICDPACGSGHFLLAAARRLADEVALHRAAAEREGGTPTPADYRHALRDVVGRCIHGVDKNPMAIELAKTALWLEAYSPDRPLGFLDHHLRVGDALLGVLDPKVLEHGIPDEAYAALSGDDKEVAKALKKQNKADLKSWRAIAAGDLLTQAGLAAQAVTVESLATTRPSSLAAKREAWAAANKADARQPASPGWPTPTSPPSWRPSWPARRRPCRCQATCGVCSASSRPTARWRTRRGRCAAGTASSTGGWRSRRWRHAAAST